MPPKNTYKEPAPVPLIGVHAEGTVSFIIAQPYLSPAVKALAI